MAPHTGHAPDRPRLRPEPGQRQRAARGEVGDGQDGKLHAGRSERMEQPPTPGLSRWAARPPPPARRLHRAAKRGARRRGAAPPGRAVRLRQGAGRRGQLRGGLPLLPPLPRGGGCGFLVSSRDSKLRQVQRADEVRAPALPGPLPERGGARSGAAHLSGVACQLPSNRAAHARTRPWPALVSRCDRPRAHARGALGRELF
mmetsp:Transcript_3396/g.8480  ORF Transcript_3396/g.8480 Transcript_3396/m.8480 type:complete len:201 (+) Transcript_3396:943-1545(+)